MESDEELDYRKHYRKLLRRREWRERREELLAKSPRCQKCGRLGGRLAVHHPEYTYGRQPWDYPDDEYMVVCAGRCHREADEEREEQQRDAKNFRQYGWQWGEGKQHQRPNRRESEKLAKYEAAFRAWLWRKEILHDQWNWETWPIWFLWNQLSKQFFAEQKPDERQGLLGI